MKIKEKELSLEDIQICEYIKNNEKEEYEKIIENDSKIETILALSSIRQNIIKWYPFRENSTVLEIGANYGELTQVLCERLSKVVALEGSEEKRNAIIERNKEKLNLEVVGDIEKLNEKFDYITIIGIENIKNDFQEILEELKKYLNTDGIILMAANNRLGMQYFSKTSAAGENITNQSEEKLYTLKELEKQINKAGYTNFKIYYPMTDYKLTNVIFTDKKPLSKNNLARNIVYNSEDTIKFYDQNEAYREVLEENEGVFRLFANSFFIEIFKGDYIENEIRLVAFSNMRKPQYRIQTIMKKDFVYKYADSEISKKHLENIKENIEILKQSGLNTIDDYDKEKIISKYTEELTLDKVIINLIKEHKQKEAIDLINKFKEELVNNLEKSHEDKNVFDELDNKIQEEIRDEITWKVHTQGRTMLDLKREKLTDNHNMNLLKIDNEQKENIIQQKEEEIKKLKIELDNIYNSKSWKITKPLRQIKKLRNKQ